MKTKRIFLLTGNKDIGVKANLYPVINELFENGIISRNDFELIQLDSENLISTDISKKHMMEDAELYLYLTELSESVEKLIKHIFFCRGIVQNNIKVILESPYGKDYEDMVRMNHFLGKYFDDNQIFRIEHCLGNTGTDRLLDLKNKESINGRWNKDYIEEFQFIFTEKETGNPEKILQTHILQLMIPCITDEPDLEDEGEKINALETILDSFNTGMNSFEYKRNSELKKEILIYGKISIDSGRWRGVDFRLTAGKCMPEKRAEVHIKFKNLQHPVIIDFLKNENRELSVYATLLKDCFAGKKQRFLSAEEAELLWKIQNNIKKLLDKNFMENRNNQ